MSASLPHSFFSSLLYFVQPFKMIGSIISMKNGWLQNSRETELSTKDGYILLSEMPAREILPFPLLHINIPLMSKFVACLIETH